MSYVDDLELARKKAELAEAEAQKAQENARIKQQQQVLRERSEERREQAFIQNLKRAIAGAGIVPNPSFTDDDFLGVVRSQWHFDIAMDGSFRVRDAQTKQFLGDFDVALKNWASANSRFVDSATIKRLSTPLENRSRSEMTQAEKIAFIDKFGLSAFEALPMRPVVPEKPIDQLTAADWKAMPNSQKAAILGQLGPNADSWLSDLLKVR